MALPRIDGDTTILAGFLAALSARHDGQDIFMVEFAAYAVSFQQVGTHPA
ncbi:MAG: hypothetical protein M9908_07625 [Phyllobacteriaceae bacterium]|nr:hypothetical protein [Phyllobacteriaceae bacterium]